MSDARQRKLMNCTLDIVFESGAATAFNKGHWLVSASCVTYVSVFCVGKSVPDRFSLLIFVSSSDITCAQNMDLNSPIHDHV